MFFCALLLALSWVDYSSNGAFVRDWRQLYYVVIFSAFFLTFLTPYASVVFSRNRHDTDYSRQKKTSLLIASTLLIITPILCAFSVHGLVLIVLTSITLLIPYLVISNISINDANIDSKTWRALPFALLVFNFAYMAIDPILYINPSASLFPIVPILALFSAVLMFFFTVQSLTTKIGPIKLGKKLTSSLSKYRLDSPAPPYEITNQLITLFFNVFVLIIFYACYLVKDFIMHNRETFAFTFFDQPLGGLGGLYSLSWITLPVLINIFAILTSLMVFALRKVIAEEDTSENGESGTHE